MAQKNKAYRSIRLREFKRAYSFLLPAMILLAIFVIYPIIGTIIISFEGESSLTLDNYIAVLTEKSPSKALILTDNIGKTPPWGALVHNIVWIAIHVPVTTFLGLILAYALVHVYGRSIVKSLVFLSMVIPMVVGGLIIRFIFDAQVGVIPRLFSLIGLEGLSRTWTAYPQTALFSLIIGSIWLWLGFSLTIHSAAVDSIPKSFIEAARIDGASELQIFRHIVAPSVWPATLTVMVMTLLWDLKIFDIVYAATQGGPGGSSTVLAYVMWLYFARALDYGKAAATAVILTILTLIAASYMIRRSLRGG
ncbi:MAG: sugar ABC transporter permease [Desulfurococcales archaeon]|nr:sugar ABC transporter permease [Desulfurococcales archaeon]MEB3779957.1 sugar ABC transporter permease [Desulfurococcales archaeon]